MLDDLKMIHQRDAQDALGQAGKQSQQLGYAFELTPGYMSGPVNSVIYAGMGTAALSGDMARVWAEVGKPFEVIRGFDVPAYADAGTLFIAASYAGDDTETLDALVQAEAKGAQIVVITSGGEMADIARTRQYPLLLLPQYTQQGQALFVRWYMLKALLTVLEAAGLVQGRTDELASQAKWLAGTLGLWRPDVPASSNSAKQIALELMGKSVVVYAGPLLSPAAYGWKSNINRYAKQIAWQGQYPECNYNDLAGWSKQPVHKPYAVIELRSLLENEYIQKSYAATTKLLSGLRPTPVIVEPAGETLLQQLLYATALGDFVSLYLALLGGINPATSDLVDNFKKELR